MEVLQVFDFDFNHVYMTDTHFILIRNSEVVNITFDELAQGPVPVMQKESVPSMQKEQNVEIISSSISGDNLVVYSSDKVLRFYNISQGPGVNDELPTPDFTEHIPESEDISKIALNQNILVKAVRTTDSNFL
jgi:WD40 repeat protein